MKDTENINTQITRNITEKHGMFDTINTKHRITRSVAAAATTTGERESEGKKQNMQLKRKRNNNHDNSTHACKTNKYVYLLRL